MVGHAAVLGYLSPLTLYVTVSDESLQTAQAHSPPASPASTCTTKSSIDSEAMASPAAKLVKYLEASPTPCMPNCISYGARILDTIVLTLFLILPQSTPYTTPYSVSKQLGSYACRNANDGTSSRMVGTLPRGRWGSRRYSLPSECLNGSVSQQPVLHHRVCSAQDVPARKRKWLCHCRVPYRLLQLQAEADKQAQEAC